MKDKIKFFFVGKSKKIKGIRRAIISVLAVIAIALAIFFGFGGKGGNTKLYEDPNYYTTIVSKGKVSSTIYAQVMLNALKNLDYEMRIGCFDSNKESTYFIYKHSASESTEALYDPNADATYTVKHTKDGDKASFDGEHPERFSDKDIIDMVESYSPQSKLGGYFDGGKMVAYEYEGRLFFFDHDYISEDVYIFTDKDGERFEKANIILSKSQGKKLRYEFTYK